MMLVRSRILLTRPDLQIFGQLRPIRVVQRTQFQTRLYATSSPALNRLANFANIVGTAYAGGLVICCASLFFLYKDATSRQPLPLDLGINNTITAVKAIGKDDVLQSPRYAVKHYRRLLIELAKREDPYLEFDETLSDGSRNYAVPLLPADNLIEIKNAKFANFYVDMVLRYAKALLTKGLLDDSVSILKRIVDDDKLFYSVGDPERMSECCCTLSRVTENSDEQYYYLKRSIKMLTESFLNMDVDDHYILASHSQVSDELLLSLNAMAFAHARESTKLHKKQKMQQLAQALNIYLANLQVLSKVRDKIALKEASQASYPLLNCDMNNLNMSVAEIKAHVSEILWAKGLQDSAIAWGEEVIHDIFFENAQVARASPILDGVLKNLKIMYKKKNNSEAVKRCQELQSELVFFEAGQLPWYDSLIRRFTKIIYYRGPLGIIERPLKERFGPPEPSPDIEEYEDEDQE